jgi:flagellar biosynthesis protein FlhG
MSWSQALRPLDLGPSASAGPGEPVPRPRRAASICVASGKGGTGKSIVSASLAQLFAGRGRTLLVDADMGVGNAHILQNIAPRRSFVDVVAGRCEVAEAVQACGERLHLLSAGSGVSRMAGLSTYELHLIAGGLESLEGGYDYLVVDSAAGISEQTVAFAAACDLVLVVTTPDLTAVTDAYAFIKVLHQRSPHQVPLVLVNRVDPAAGTDPHEGEQTGARVAERIAGVCQRFLDMQPRWIGTIPEDRSVVKSVAARRPVVVYDPACPASVALTSLAEPLAGELGRIEPRGMGLSLRQDAAYAG